MALDPKYSSLPWIATGQPDLYETSDLPEVDQAYPTTSYGDETSENIENPSLKVKDGAQQFKNKDLNIDQNTDFSDKLCKDTGGRRKAEGSGEGPDEDEEAAGGSRSRESVVERYERVVREIGELKAELAAGGDQPASPDQPITLDQLRDLVGALETQITEHKLDQVLGPDAKGLPLDIEASISSALKTQVQRLQEGQDNAEKAERVEAARRSRSVVYELFHAEDVERLQNLDKLSGLNERLVRLERTVGVGADVSKLSALTANTTHKGLLEASSKMSQAAALLDGAQLDQLESRLTALTNRLGQMSERRETEMDSDTQNRVAALYTLVKQHEKMADSLPGLVDRITALKSLHTDALHFSQSLSQLDSRQQLLGLSVRSHCRLLENMEEGLEQNLEILSRNADSLADRLKALGK